MGGGGFSGSKNIYTPATRRAPQSMLGLTQAFDASKFNFTKINPERELIFKLRGGAIRNITFLLMTREVLKIIADMS